MIMTFMAHSVPILRKRKKSLNHKYYQLNNKLCTRSKHQNGIFMLLNRLKRKEVNYFEYKEKSTTQK